MIMDWIVCKSVLPHDPRVDVCILVVAVEDEHPARAQFNVWLTDNGLYAYTDRSYRKFFEKRQQLPASVPFDRKMEVRI